MLAVSRQTTARNMAAEMAANIGQRSGSTTDSAYSVNSFAPTARQVSEGDTVQFITNVTNGYDDSREAQIFVKLNGTTVAVESKYISPNETRDVAQSKSYSDLTAAVNGDGEYVLSVEVHWVSGPVTQTKTWGTMTLGSSDSNESDDSDLTTRPCPDGYSWSPNARQCRPDDPGDDETKGIPKMYLYAGGGAFFFLFVLVLVA